MTIKYARELLNVRENDNTETIHHHYRLLLKKYHPDLYQKQKAFYTIMMSRINHAYQLLTTRCEEVNKQKDCTAPPSSETQQSEKTATAKHETREAENKSGAAEHAKSNVKHEDTLRGCHPAHPRIINIAYRPYIERAREAICHYYSYNLYNIHLRGEGSTRTHFRIVQNKFTKLLKIFEQHITRTNEHNTDSSYYFLFCQSFFNSMQSELRMRTSLNRQAYKLYKIYRDCTLKLENIIEDRYCNIRNRMQTPPIDTILFIQYSFQQLAEENEQLGLRNAAIIKRDLASAFYNTMYWIYDN